MTYSHRHFLRVLRTLCVRLIRPSALTLALFLRAAALPKGDRIVTTYRNVRAHKTVEAKFDFTPPAGAHVSTPLGD